MNKGLKKSKFNFYVKTSTGDLLIYNFLTGLESLTMIPNHCIHFFESICEETEISEDMLVRNKDSFNKLLKTGILVNDDVNEIVLLEARKYEYIYDNTLVLTILPTGNCNFNCPYCFENTKRVIGLPMTEASQKALTRFVQKQVVNSKKVHICWFGGEPLLEYQIIENLSRRFIQICKSRYIPYSAEIITNGYLLSIDMFDLLYGLKVYNYTITLDGFEEQHDKTRYTLKREGTFNTIINNLLTIRDHKQYKNAHILIRTNITKQLLSVLDEFITFLDTSFSGDPRFSFQFSPVKNFSDFEFIDNIIADSDDLMIQLKKNDTYMNKLRAERDKINIVLPDIGCSANRKNSYVITPDLMVHKCCVHYDMEGNQIGQIDLSGNLCINNLLHERWYVLNKYIQDIPQKCYECFYFPACHTSGRICPVYYLGTHQENMKCMLDNDLFIKSLPEIIVYLASNYECKRVCFDFV